MCYNCGCQLPKEDMGKGKISQGGGSLTDDDFKVMAQKWGGTVEDMKENTYELLKKELNK